MAYTTKAKVDALFGISMPQAVFDDIYAAVKAFIDNYTGRTFEAAAGDYYYDGNGQSELFIGSILASGAVVSILDENGNVEKQLVEGQGNDYILAPYNSTEKTSIILTGNAGYSYWPSGVRRVKVTGSQGASTAVPGDIALAAAQLVGEIYNGGTGGVKSSESLGDYSVSYESVSSTAESMGVMNVLDMHRDIDI